METKLEIIVWGKILGFRHFRHKAFRLKYYFDWYLDF